MRSGWFLIPLLVLAANVVQAQDFDRFFSVSWQGNTPLSNTEWIDDFSGSGLRIGYRKMLNDRFAVGGDFSWAAYETYVPRATYFSEDGAITTDYFNSLYAYEIMLGGQYFFPVGTDRIMPYAGLGLGAALNRYVQSYNIYADRDDSWGFAARPELGIMFPFGGKVGAFLSANYTYTTAGSDLFGYDDFSHLGFQAGLVLMSY